MFLFDTKKKQIRILSLRSYLRLSIRALNTAGLHRHPSANIIATIENKIKNK